MEIISRSNHGFRKRPSFQKIANKPNKNINYVINPLQIVRDSYEFSNLINDDNFVEDEIKNKITDELFHEEVQKEILRRETMEQDRKNRTLIDLQGNIPTNLPEMAAQQRVQTFDISAEPPDMQVDELTNAPTQTAEDMNVDTRVKLKARRSIPPPQAAPPEAPPPIIGRTVDMDAEPVSKKRQTESREERIRKAAKGTEVITSLSDTMKTKA